MKAQTRLLSPQNVRQESKIMLSSIALTMITIVALLITTAVV